MGYVILICECMIFLDSSVVRTCNICPLQRLMQQKSQETSWTWLNPFAHLDIAYAVLFPVGISQTCHQTWLADAWTITESPVDLDDSPKDRRRIFPFKASMVSICFNLFQFVSLLLFFFQLFTWRFSFFSYVFPMQTAPGPSLCHLGGCRGGQGVDGCYIYIYIYYIYIYILK